MESIPIKFYMLSPEEFDYRRGASNSVMLVIENNHNEQITVERILNIYNSFYHSRPSISGYHFIGTTLELNVTLASGQTYQIRPFTLINKTNKHYKYSPTLIVTVKGRLYSIPLSSREETPTVPGKIIGEFMIRKYRRKLEITLQGLPTAAGVNYPLIFNLNTLKNPNNPLGKLFQSISETIKVSPFFIPETTIKPHDLRGLGGLLYNALNQNNNLVNIESELKKLNVEHLWFYGETHIIPWEILRTGNEVFGTRYSISRWFKNPGDKNLYYVREKHCISGPLKIFVISSNFTIEDIDAYEKYGDNYLKIIQHTRNLNTNDEVEMFKKLKDKWGDLVDVHILEIGLNDEDGDGKNIVKYWNDEYKETYDLRNYRTKVDDYRDAKKRVKPNWEKKAAKVIEIIGTSLNAVDFDILHLSGEHYALPPKYITNTQKSGTTKGKKTRTRKTGEDVFVVSPVPSVNLQVTPKMIKSWFQNIGRDRKLFLTFGNFCNSAGDEFLHETFKTLSFVQRSLAFSSNFIGSFNFVVASLAPKFAEIFYNLLIGDLNENKGTPISTILKNTRIEFSKKYPNEILWAWFVHYGFPLSRLEKCNN